MSDAALRARLTDELRAAWTVLPDKPDETVELTLRALWFAAAGDPRPLWRVEEPLPPLSPHQRRALEVLVDRRVLGEPLAHLTGRQGFLGLDLLAGPEALIPRRETELLAQTALALLGEANAGAPRLVLDLCTGAGNVALAIASRCPSCTVIATDLDPAACALARENARRLALAHRVTVREGDLFAPVDEPALREAFALVSCNPPYISSAGVDRLPREIGAFEPRLAFDGGAFGMDLLLRLVREAPRWLAPGAWLCFEVGAGQGEFMAKRLRANAAYADVRTIADAGGAARVVAARRP